MRIGGRITVFGLPIAPGRGSYAVMQPSQSIPRRAWLWPWLVAAVIFTESCRSNVAEPDIANVDKYAHFLVYGLLGTLIVRWRRGGRWAPWLALVLASLYGVSDEFHQWFVPGRSCEFLDWVADTTGAALAIFLYTRVTWYRRLLEMPLERKRRVENPAAVATVSES